MPAMTADCGCTLDPDFVSMEHHPEGNPYHTKLKADPAPEPVEPAELEAEPEAEPGKKQKRSLW